MMYFSTKYQGKILTTKNVKLLIMIRLLKKLKALMVYNKAVHAADLASSREGGNRYYVMPSTRRGKVIIVDRANFRLLRKKHYVNKDMKIQDCVNNCFYHTKDRKGEAMHPLLIEKGRKRFIDWALYKEGKK